MLKPPIGVMHRPLWLGSWCAGFALACAVLAGHTFAANLVPNGGFETGNFTGWTVVPATSGSYIYVSPPGHTGNYSALFGASGAYDDTISQSLSTIAGQSYSVDFWLYHTLADSENDFTASWNGIPLLSLTGASAFGWTQYTYSVTAAAASSTIQFAGRENPAYFYLDDVSVTANVPTLTWTGATNGTWSLASSDANWSGPTTTYSDNTGVTFSDSGANHNITIASGGVQPASVTFINNTTSYTLSGGPIGGPASVTLSGSGIVAFANSNTYSGGTTIGGGILNVNADAALGAVPALPATNVTFSGNGTLQAGAATVSLSANRSVAINGGFTATIDTQGNMMTIPGVISGAGSLAEIGSGTLILTASNTYTGGTTIGGGILNVNSDAALGAVPAAPVTNLTFSGNGTLQADAARVSLSGNRSVVINGGVTATIDTQGNIMTIPGAISGAGSLAKIGSGTLSLAGSNANTFSGGTTISAGTLVAGAGGLGTASVNVAPGATLAVTQTGSVGLASLYYDVTGPVQANFNSLTALQSHIGSLGTPGAIAATPVLNLNNGGATFPAAIGSNDFEGYLSGMISITNSGVYSFATGSDDGSMIWLDGQLVVSNNNLQSFSYPQRLGSIALSAGYHNIVMGYYQITGGYSFEAGVSGPDTSGSTVDLGSASSPALTPDLVAPSLSGGGNVNLQTGNLIVGSDNANSTFSGTISSSGPAAAIAGVLKVGGGNLTLTGSLNYGGETTISGGTLQLGDGSSGHDAALSTGGISNTAALVYNVFGSQTANYPISGNGSLTKAGPGTLLLAGGNYRSYSGKTYLTGGAIVMNTADNIAGLYEGLVNNANSADTTDPIPLTSIQSVARWGASTSGDTNSPANNIYPNWADNTTWGYDGYLLNKSTSAITYNFGKNFDDNAFLVIDGVTVIDNTTWNSNATGNITLGPGLHTVDLRFGQNSVGVGPNTGAYGNYGVAYNTVANTLTTGVWNQMGASDPNTQFYATVTGAPNSSMVMSGSTTLDLSAAGLGLAALGSLSDAAGSPTGQQVLLGGNTLDVGLDNASTTFSGAISGSGGSLIKQGTGTLALAGTNTYTGTTTVSAGILMATTTASLPGYSTSGKVSVIGGAVVAVQSGDGSTGWNSAQIDSLRTGANWISNTAALGIDTSNGDFTYGGNITQALSLIKLGANTLTLTGSNSYSGLTTIGGGTLQLGDGTSGHDATLATSLIVNNSALVYNVFASQTANYAVSGNGSLTKAGSGSLAFSGSSYRTYTGATFLTAGTIAMRSANTAGLYEGLVSDLNAADTSDPIPLTSVQSVARWGASTSGETNGPANNIYPNWADTTTWGYSGYILNKSASAITYDFGKNFDDGAFLVIDGVSVINDANYGDNLTGSITLGPGLHSVDLRFGQGAGGVGPNSGAYGSYGVAYNTVGNTLTTGVWNQMGASDPNTQFYAAVRGAPNSSMVMSASTTLDLSAAGLGMAALGSLSDAAGAPTGQQVLLGGNTLDVGLDNSSTTFSGAISGSGGSLIKQGAGTFTLAGTNTYTGTTTASAGILLATTTASLPGYNTSGKVDVAAGAVLAVQTGTASSGWNSAQIDSLRTATNWTSNTAALGIDTSNGNFTYGSNITQPLALTKLGGNMLTLTGANTYSGPTTISGGTLQLGDGTSGHDATLATGGIVNNSALVYNVFASQTANYPISGSGGLTKTGSGTLTLSGAETYAGPTVVTQGTLKLGLPSVANALPITNFAAFGTAVTGYQDFFNTGSLNPAWVSNTAGVFSLVANGGLTSSSGYLSVNGNGSDPTHLLYEPGGLAASGNMEILALVQLNSISSGQDASRAGVGVAVAPGSSRGFDELFHGSSYPNSIDTLNDFISWGPSIYYTYSTNTKYWMELTVSGSTNVTAKFWPANGSTPESSAATTTWTQAADSGFAGITGPSGVAANMNVYYVLVENSQLPAITAGQTSASAASLPSGTALLIAAGATFDLNGNGEKIASLADGAGGGSVINSNTAAASLILSPSGGASTFSGSIEGGGTLGTISLVMNGIGTQVLAGSNSYTGPTTVESGTLLATTTAALPGYTTAGKVSVAGGVLAVQTGNGTAGWSSAQIDLLRTTTNWSSDSAALGIDTSNGSFSYGSNITQAVGLVKLGVNTLTLTGANAYTGGTQINAGILDINGDTALGAAGTPLSFTGNGTLQAGANAIAVDSGRTITVNSGVTATIDTQGFTMSIAGPISGQGGLTKAGSGGLDLTAVNSYSGLTTISGGTLQIGNGGSGELLSSSSINDNGTLVFNHADALVYGGPIVGTGNLVKQGPGTLTLTAGNSFSGGTTILGGTLKLVGGVSGFGGSGLGWTVNSSGISSTPITNNVLTLTDNNGAEARSAFYDTPVPVGPFTASFIYQAGGSLGADGVAFVLQNDVHGLSALGVNGGGLGYGGIDQSAAFQFNLYNGPGTAWNVNGATGNYNTSTGLGLAQGHPILAVLTYSGSSLSAQLTDLVTAAAFYQSYPVNLAQVISGSSLYVGFTGGDGAYVSSQTVSDFVFASGSMPGNNILPANGPVRLGSGAVLDLSGANQTIASLADAVPGATVGNQVLLAGGSLTVGDSSSTTFSGSISGIGGSLTKVGSGTLSLVGANSYTGSTTINAGRLAVDGSLVSPVTVNSGAMLSGTGSLAGVTVNTGGHLAPGDLGIGGMLIGGEMDFDGGELDVVGAGTSVSSLSIAGNLVLSDDSTLNFGGALAGGTYVIASYGGVLSGEFTALDLPAGYVVDYGTGNDSAITISPVPEPGTLVLLVAGALGLMGCAWRRRTQNFDARFAPRRDDRE